MVTPVGAAGRVDCAGEVVALAGVVPEPEGAAPGAAATSVVLSGTGTDAFSSVSETFAGRTRARSRTTPSHDVRAARTCATAVARAASAPWMLASICGPFGCGIAASCVCRPERWDWRLWGFPWARREAEPSGGGGARG